eukprot:Gb_00023 [translate_table: standard]
MTNATLSRKISGKHFNYSLQSFGRKSDGFGSPLLKQNPDFGFGNCSTADRWQKRQMFLRSYNFTTKQTLPQKLKSSLTEAQGGHLDFYGLQRQTEEKTCSIVPLRALRSEVRFS